MKKFISFIVLAFFSFCIQAADFKEGTHYTVLKAPHSKSQTVTEYFSFYCPHCFQFESVVKGLKAKLPKSAKFEKVQEGNQARKQLKWFDGSEVNGELGLFFDKDHYQVSP